MSWMDKFKYEGPVGEGPDGWTVEVVEPDPFHAMHYILDGRDAGKGPFHVLRKNRLLWMSDTDAELRDHVGPLVEVRRKPGARVLIHGLGLGLVTAAAIREGASHVDVVELDGALIDWMGPWLMELGYEHDATVTFHEANCLEKQWEPGTRWNVVWHDIWPELSDDNLPEMKQLHRSFGRRTDWQGSWGRERIELEKRRGRWG